MASRKQFSGRDRKALNKLWDGLTQVGHVDERRSNNNAEENKVEQVLFAADNAASNAMKKLKQRLLTCYDMGK